MIPFPKQPRLGDTFTWRGETFVYSFNPFGPGLAWGRMDN